MRREVEGVLPAQQLGVSGVDVLLGLVRSVVIVIFHLCDHKGSRLAEPEATPPRHTESVCVCVCVWLLTGAGPFLLNQPGRSQPCLSWNTHP